MEDTKKVSVESENLKKNIVSRFKFLMNVLQIERKCPRKEALEELLHFIKQVATFIQLELDDQNGKEEHTENKQEE